MLLLTPLCMGVAGCRSSTAATPAAAEQVPVRAVLTTVADVPLEVAAVGTVEPIASVEVKARVSGQISAVRFREGQDVRKGQLLFTVNPDMLQRQAAEQQATIARDNAVAQQARAIVVRDTAAQRQSRSEAETALTLAQDGVLSRQRADQITTANDSALATLHADESAASSAVASASADRARLAQTELQLHLTGVTAPISGRTGAVLAKAGNIVREQDTTLVQLLQMAPIYVSFGIPEQALSEVQRLNAAHALRVDAGVSGGGSATGTLAFIDNTIDIATGTIRLKAAFDNRDGKLWPGEFVNVRLRLHMDAAQIVVPTVAVQQAQQGPYLWVVTNGVTQMRPVIVRRTYVSPLGGEWAVLDGIAPGVQVVTEGQLRITAGSHVQFLAPVQSVLR